MTTAVTMQDAQAAIVAMMEECGLSQVNICVKPEYNRYTKASWNGGGGVFHRFADLATLAEEMKPAPKMVQSNIFNTGD